MVKFTRTKIEVMRAVKWDGLIASAKEIKSLFPSLSVSLVVEPDLQVRLFIKQDEWQSRLVNIGEYVADVNGSATRMTEDAFAGGGWTMTNV